jgi:hypothetical protein
MPVRLTSPVADEPGCAAKAAHGRGPRLPLAKKFCRVVFNATGPSFRRRFSSNVSLRPGPLFADHHPSTPIDSAITMKVLRVQSVQSLCTLAG